MEKWMRDLLPSLYTPHKIDRPVLSPSYRAGAFDSHAVDCPFLFRHDERYYMTFVGWDGIGYRTGLASSDDLLTWQKEGMIIDRGPQGSVTEFNAALTSILRDNALHGPSTLKKAGGRFVGTYHAYPGAGYEDGPAVIGLCFSEDLRHWEIGKPVLRPGTKGRWDSGGLYKSWLLEHAGTFYLFYNAKNQPDVGWTERTGFATSPDLVHWQKYPGNPVLDVGAAGAFDGRFCSDPCVLRHRDRWLLFYFGLSSDGVARDSVAVAKNLTDWQKSNEILIDVGAPGSIDSRYAHKPGMIGKDGRLYHFYCAVAPSPTPQIGDIVYDEIRGIAVAHN